MKKLTLLILGMTGLSLVACNGGGSSSSDGSGGGGENTNGYDGPLPVSYSQALPNNQGNLISVNNLVLPAQTAESIYFTVGNFSGSPVTINFTVKANNTVGTTGSKLKSTSVPTLTPDSCTFSANQNNCTITISGAESGNYSIEPWITITQLNPINLTTMPPAQGLISGRYSMSGDVRIDNCQSEPLQFGSYMTVSNGQLCINIGGSSNCIGVANPYYRTFPSVSVYQYSDEDIQTENAFQFSNGTIYTYSYFSSCPGLVSYMQATKQ